MGQIVFKPQGARYILSLPVIAVGLTADRLSGRRSKTAGAGRVIIIVVVVVVLSGGRGRGSNACEEGGSADCCGSGGARALAMPEGECENGLLFFKTEVEIQIYQWSP